MTEWTLTSEAMPPDGEFVLCALYGVRYPVALRRVPYELDNKHMWEGGMTANEDASVHSWAPLPEFHPDFIRQRQERRAFLERAAAAMRAHP